MENGDPAAARLQRKSEFREMYTIFFIFTFARAIKCRGFALVVKLANKDELLIGTATRHHNFIVRLHRIYFNEYKMKNCLWIFPDSLYMRMRRGTRLRIHIHK